MPLNTYNNKAPLKATIKSVKRIVGPKATGETCEIVIQTDGKIPYWEGQSYGIIPPVSARWLDIESWVGINWRVQPYSAYGCCQCCAALFSKPPCLPLSSSAKPRQCQHVADPAYPQPLGCPHSPPRNSTSASHPNHCS